MISKELLSEVLDLYITDITYPVMESQTSLFSDKPEIIPNYSIMEYTGSNGFMGATLTINIHELAFKCKEWALKQGYMIVTFGNGYFIYDMKELYDPMEQLDKWIEDGLSTSEQQAVFDACQRILDNRNNK